MSKRKGESIGQMRRVRELCMQVLCLWDANGALDRDAAEQTVADATQNDEVRRQAMEMANGVWESRQLSDQWVERLAPQWPPRRQPLVDRNILRLAVWELTHRPTPPKVVIDEAIELAKHYSTDQSASFVNGVIDAVLKEHHALTNLAPANGTTPASQTSATSPDHPGDSEPQP